MVALSLRTGTPFEVAGAAREFSQGLKKSTDMEKTVLLVVVPATFCDVQACTLKFLVPAKVLVQWTDTGLRKKPRTTRCVRVEYESRNEV